MLVTMLVSTGGPNGTACLVGEVHDLPDALAQHWIVTGRAVVMSDDAPEPAAPVVATRPLKPKRTR